MNLFIRIFLIISILLACHCSVIDQDNFRNSSELIESRGFRSETHKVVTQDGYILTVFRVVNPYKTRTRKRPVILWHGVLSYSDLWLISTAGQLRSDGVYIENNEIFNDCQSSVTSTLSYTLSACGYDVWLANTRGNKYSDHHIVYDNQKPEYWQYTFTELGVYDARGVVEYVMNVTGQESVAYIGHSLGSTSMFILLSLVPEFERHVRPFVALAPFCYMSHMTSSVRAVAQYEPILRSNPQGIGIPVAIAQFMGVFICGNQYFIKICADFHSRSVGYDPANLNLTRVPIYTSHSFATVSSWVLAQIGQLIQSKTFSAFDSGPDNNMQLYGQTHPPEYPLWRIRSHNIAIYYGLSDKVANFTDVRTLIRKIPVRLLDEYQVPYTQWTHQDFHYGINSGTFINSRILNLLKSFY